MNNRLAAASFPWLDISIPELVAGIEGHAAWVSECLKTPHDAWIPQVFVITKATPDADRVMHVFSLAVNFGDRDAKRKALRNVGRSIFEAKTCPAAVVMSTEVWIAPDWRGGEPQFHPERKEGIVVQAKTLLSQACGMTRMLTTRDANGDIVPSQFEPVLTEGVTINVLSHIFAGFYDAAKAAVKARRKRTR